MKAWKKPEIQELDVLNTFGANYHANEKNGDGGAQQGGNWSPDNPNPNLPSTGSPTI